MDLQHALATIEIELDLLHTVLHKSLPDSLRNLIDLMDEKTPEGELDQLPEEERRAGEALQRRLFRLRTVLSLLSKT